MKVTLLGCGGSGGVPLAGREAGGHWGNCDPSNPRNRRRRVSVLVEQAGTSVLVDTSPDLRLQMLDAGIERLDAVLYTHAHADHCHGVDDLRWIVYAQGRPIDAYMDMKTQETMTRRFPYAFASSADPASFYTPLLIERLIEGPFKVGALEVLPFVQGHGRETSLGFRFGPVAYSTDVVELDALAFEVLDGVELWIVDCLREAPHPTHAHFAKALEWIDRIKPRRAVLTHMNHTVDYDALAARCPPGVEPGYDGLVIEVETEAPAE
jgi:phosphoribosyl 1,2-cyclic phosphate phosphodiesterase